MKNSESQGNHTHTVQCGPTDQLVGPSLRPASDTLTFPLVMILDIFLFKYIKVNKDVFESWINSWEHAAEAVQVLKGPNLHLFSERSTKMF